MRGALLLCILTVLLVIPAVPISGQDEVIPTRSDDTQISDPIKDRMTPQHVWPTYKGNYQRSGLSLFNASRNPGCQRWNLTFDGNLDCSPVIDANDNIYVTSYGELFCIDPNGTVLWTVSTNGSRSASSPSIGPDGCIVFWNTNGYLHSVYPNGTLKWSVMTRPFYTVVHLLHSPLINENNTIFIKAGNRTFGIYGNNGTVRWVHSNGWEMAGPCLDRNGMMVTSSCSQISRYHDNGSVVNISYAYTQGGCISSSLSLDHRDYFYYANSWGTNYVHGSHPNINTPSWRSGIVNFRYGSSVSIDGDQNAFFESTILTKYDTRGNELAYFYSDRDDPAEPVLDSAGNLFFVMGSDRPAMVASDNSYKWTFNTTGRYHTPAIGRDGTIYVCDESSDTLTAIGSIEPDPPELSANPLTDTIMLTWKPGFDGGDEIISFRIYKGRSGDDLKHYIDVDPTERGYEDIEVDPDHYHYAISALNINGESEISNVVKVRRAPDPPIIDEVSVLDGSIYIQWSTPASNVRRVLQKVTLWRKVDDENFKVLTVKSADSSSHMDGDVTIGRTYSYFLTCSDEETTSAPSVTVSTGYSTIPSQVDNYYLEYIIDSGVAITWYPPESDGGAPIRFYHVYRQGQGMEVQFVGSADAYQELFFIDTDLLRGMKVEYWVIAENMMGGSLVPDTIKMVKITEDPPAPFNLVPTSMDRKIFVRWDVPETGPLEDPEWFEMNISSELGYELIIIDDKYIRNHTLTDLQNGVEYRIRIRSGNQDGVSAWVEILSSPGKPPDPPVVLEAELNKNGLYLLWLPPEDKGGSPILAYWINIETEGRNETVRLNSTTGTFQRSYRDIPAEMTVTFRAENRMGFSRPRQKFLLYEEPAVPLQFPEPPIEFHIDGGPDFVMIEWGFSPDVIAQGISNVNIYRGEGLQEPVLYISVPWTAWRYNDTDVEPDHNYTYYLTSENPESESAPTRRLRVLVHNGTGPEENITGSDEGEEKANHDAYIIGGILFLIIIVLAALVSFNLDKLRNIGAPPDGMGDDEEYDIIDAEDLHSRGSS